MGCGGHDVQPSQNVLHQGSMQVLIIAPSPAVAPIDCTLRSGEQGSRAAGEVRNPQPFDSGPVRPVHIQPLDRQFREQAGRLRQCVEGGEELAICDEGLKHPPWKSPDLYMSQTLYFSHNSSYRVMAPQNHFFLPTT